MSNGSGRILEVGHFCLFKRTLPDRTDFIDLSLSADDHAGVGRQRPGPLAQRRIAGTLASGDYGLIVLHAPERSPREVGFWLDALRRPMGLTRAAWARRALDRDPQPAVAVLDYGDRRVIAPHNYPLLDLCRTYFKRELAPDAAKAFGRPLPDPEGADAAARALWQRRLARTRPISLGISAERLASLPPAEGPKEIDVFFAGRLHGWPTLRAEGLKQLQELRALGYRIDLADRLPLPEFLDRCAASWLVWSPEGLGWDCFRHYEAAACGSVPLVSAPTIRRHAPLLDDVHCLVYDVEGDGLTRRIVSALADKARLSRIAAAARAHVLAEHTHPALCAYIERSALEAV